MRQLANAALPQVPGHERGDTPLSAYRTIPEQLWRIHGRCHLRWCVLTRPTPRNGSAPPVLWAEHERCLAGMTRFVSRVCRVGCAHAGLESAARGSGVSASFATSPGARRAPPALPPPPPVRAPTSLQLEARVATSAELAQAVADPNVGSIIIRSHIFLNGIPLIVAGSGRNVTLSGDTASCGQPPASLSLPAASPACVLDARGLSRHFTVEAGARLALSSVALVNGFALQGGSVLAIGGVVSAQRSVFAHSRATGDGGAILGLAGSSLDVQSSESPCPAAVKTPLTTRRAPTHPLPPHLTQCIGALPLAGFFLNASSFGASGGAVAALFGSTANLSGCDFSGCAAQSGGAAAALYASALTASRSSFQRCSAAAGGALAAWNTSTLVASGISVANCRCEREVVGTRHRAMRRTMTRGHIAATLRTRRASSNSC